MMQSYTRRAVLHSGAAASLCALLPAAHQAAWARPDERKFRTVEHMPIAVSDGTRLSCRLWLPEGSERTPVGVVLEATPYSKRDGSRAADNDWGARLAAHGFAYARLDLRGTGESEGLLGDEYLAQEQADIVDVIAHLAREPWCNGSVGMRGYSWGGFNCLQVAARRPAALKAVISACSSANRYLNDAHFVGGVLALPNFLWGAMFKNVLVDAPDPAIVGDRWRAMWLERLEASPAAVSNWVSHARYDGYWRQGSVAECVEAIECGVYLVGGQADPYSRSIPPLLERLRAPRKALIGPWGHHFPHLAAPGPGLEWLDEELRWWGHWLHGEDNGAMRGPMLQAYMNAGAAAESYPADVPGQWVAEPEWPSRGIRTRRWHLNPEGLQDSAGAATSLGIEPHQVVGLATREWISLNPAIDLPGDQAADDRLSRRFDTTPLEEPLQLLGLGAASLRLAADRPVAKIVVRVTEVLADGSSWLLTYGVLNLCHRDGHDAPALLEPGRFYDVKVPLGYVARCLRRGSRIRVALSEALWPMLVPSPEPVTLTLVTGASTLELPVRVPGTAVAALPAPVAQQNVPAAPDIDIAGGERIAASGPDAAGNVRLVRSSAPSVAQLDDIGTARSYELRSEMELSGRDPVASHWKVTMGYGSVRGAWRYHTRATAELRTTPDAFEVTETIEAFEGEIRLFERRVERKFDRRFG